MEALASHAYGAANSKIAMTENADRWLRRFRNSAPARIDRPAQDGNFTALRHSEQIGHKRGVVLIYQT